MSKSNAPLSSKPFAGLSATASSPPAQSTAPDPLKTTLDALRANAPLLASLGSLQPLSAKLLASLGQVYERHGFTAARLFLADKKQRAEPRDKDAFDRLDDALETIHANLAVRKMPALGRMVLKSLRALAPQQDNRPSQSRNHPGGNR